MEEEMEEEMKKKGRRNGRKNGRRNEKEMKKWKKKRRRNGSRNEGRNDRAMELIRWQEIQMERSGNIVVFRYISRDKKFTSQTRGVNSAAAPVSIPARPGGQQYCSTC